MTALPSNDEVPFEGCRRYGVEEMEANAEDYEEVELGAPPRSGSKVGLDD